MSTIDEESIVARKQLVQRDLSISPIYTGILYQQSFFIHAMWRIDAATPSSSAGSMKHTTTIMALRMLTLVIDYGMPFIHLSERAWQGKQANGYKLSHDPGLPGPFTSRLWSGVGECFLQLAGIFLVPEAHALAYHQENEVVSWEERNKGGRVNAARFFKKFPEARQKIWTTPQ